ncbi:DUF192 domain-containing protein [Caldibacillus lycopersici]|uniref:DUF192 domain-containing protein n=1 Tax=Perspicuibacillus lycopersici TaxID=1325689 RepID=A0AAE3IRZ7_9BACI|nr:DUF192 domain-containing protein [Perspicuibacillus lycopersici]MCU9613535.1 DUF192 domain-containing protein [Perspicuibacillus lycopersici]
MRVFKDAYIEQIPIKIHMYHTFSKRLRGLMFRKKPLNAEGILLTPCNSIHMFFMYIAIDAVFLDNNDQIVYQKENVKPWTVILPKKNAVSVLELPVGTISTYSLRIGNKLEY